jgi:hypothetical protein
MAAPIPTSITYSCSYETIEDLDETLARMKEKLDDISDEDRHHRGLLWNIERTKNKRNCPNSIICDGCGQPIGHHAYMSINSPRFPEDSHYIHYYPSLERDVSFQCVLLWAARHNLLLLNQ